MDNKEIKRALREAIRDNRFESVWTLMSFLPPAKHPSMITCEDGLTVAGEIECPERLDKRPKKD